MQISRMRIAARSKPLPATPTRTLEPTCSFSPRLSASGPMPLPCLCLACDVVWPESGKQKGRGGLKVERSKPVNKPISFFLSFILSFLFPVTFLSTASSTSVSPIERYFPRHFPVSSFQFTVSVGRLFSFDFCPTDCLTELSTAG